MKWKGETEQQWRLRTSTWHRAFCWWPTQMRNGKWVWLAYAWAIRRPTVAGGSFWEYSDAAAAPEDFRPSTPPPAPRR